LKTQLLQLFKTKLILGFFFFLCTNVTFGSHYLGSEISYQCTATPGIYKITLKLYRECGFTQFCASCDNPVPFGTVSGCTIPGISVIGRSATCYGVFLGNSSNLTAVPSISGIDIIKTCNTSIQSKTICTNCNTRAAGTFSPGVEVYTFEGNINLNTLPTTCCEVALVYNVCCNNGATTNISSSAAFYAEVLLNRCITPCNSAPIFTNDATVLVCSGQDVSINLGAIDSDGDSLSYAFGQSLKSPDTSVQWIAPYNADNPFNYLGFPNPNAAAPAGLRIDPATGNLRFRPIGTWASILVIEVTQWRLIGGVYTKAGVTKRETQIRSIVCPTNLPPKILVYKDGIKQTMSANYTFEVFAGDEICLDIVSEDGWNYSNPDSTFWVRPDTTHLTWNNPGTINNLMSNATWTRNYILSQRAVSGPKNDSFKFCWTPSVNIAANTTNAFTVTGRDPSCPLPSFAQTAISIRVVPSVIITNTRNVFCNESPQSFQVNYAAAYSLNSSNLFRVQLSDASGSFSNPIIIGIKNSSDLSGNISSLMPAGLSKNANYKIRVISSSRPADTINSFQYPVSFVTGFNKPSIVNILDSICYGTKVVFKSNLSGSNYNYQWLKNNNPILVENKDSLLADTTASYRLIVSNSVCRDTSNSKSLFAHPKPTANFTSPNSICFKNSPIDIGLINSSSINNNSVLSYTWSFSDNTSSNQINPVKSVNGVGTFNIKLKVTSQNNCLDSISKNIVVNASPSSLFTINLADQCLKGNKYVFTNGSNSALTYNWLFGDNTTSSIQNPAAKTYTNVGAFNIQLIAKNANNCYDTITKTVNVNAHPIAQYTVSNASQCLNGNNFSFTNNTSNATNTNWSFGDNTSSAINNPNKSYSSVGTFNVKLIVANANNCYDTTEKPITVKTNLVIGEIMGDTAPSSLTNLYTYTIASQINASYAWSVNNGILQSGQGTNTINIKWNSKGAGIIKALIDKVNFCADSNNLTVSVNPVGIENLRLENDLSVFPNPTKTEITITNKNGWKGKQFIISNIIGQEVLRGKLNQGETTINLSELKAGTYLLSIEGVNKQAIKILKME
jgi:PKD repeat protein